MSTFQNNKILTNHILFPNFLAFSNSTLTIRRTIEVSYQKEKFNPILIINSLERGRERKKSIEEVPVEVEVEEEVTLCVIYDDDNVCGGRVVVVVDSFSPKSNQTRRISMNNKKLEVNPRKTLRTQNKLNIYIPT